MLLDTTVCMYSLRTCTYMAKKKSRLRKEGVFFFFVNVQIMGALRLTTGWRFGEHGILDCVGLCWFGLDWIKPVLTELSDGWKSSKRWIN